MCRGILLVSPDANPYASRHHTVIEGAAGFHESLVQALHLATHDGFHASATPAQTAHSPQGIPS
jgi:hypothetical protein